MKRTLSLSVCALLLFMCCGCGGDRPAPSSSGPVSSMTASPAPPPSASESSPPPSSASPTPSADGPVPEQIRSMSLEEKVGQMVLAGVKGTKVDRSAKAMIAKDHVGGIILFKDNLSGGLRPSVELINGLKQANADNPAPLFMSVDQEGGRVSRLPDEFEPMPSNAAVARTKEEAMAELMGSLIARELKLLGFNLNFDPVLDINSNPHNPVIGDRSFGNTWEVVSSFGLAKMFGLRSGGIIPVIKHFPGHGDTGVDSHLELPVVRKTAAELEKMEWLPFKTAIDAKADAVMVAHILFPNIDPDAPASLSKTIISGQLRDKLGFKGVVITDDLTMGAIVKHYGIGDAAVMSVEAGSDILLVAHGYDNADKVYKAVLDSVRSGRISESRIDESVKRILQLKQAYHISDAPVPVPARSDLPNQEIRDWRKKVSAAG